MFGTMTWLLLLLIAAIGFAGMMLMFVIRIALPIPIFIIGVSAFGWVAAVFAIRKVGRWALAVPADAPGPPQLKLVTMVFSFIVAAWIGICLVAMAMMSRTPRTTWQSSRFRSR